MDLIVRLKKKGTARGKLAAELMVDGSNTLPAPRFSGKLS